MPTQIVSADVESVTPRRLHRRTGGLTVVAFAACAGIGALVSIAAALPLQTRTPSATPSANKPAAPSAAVETFKVDAGHSAVLFRVQHLGAAYFWGRFDAVSGTISSDSASANGLSFDISVDVNSVDTASTQRDNHLKSPDFFSAKEFPTMTFKSTSAKKLDGNFYEVTGNLTLRGVTKPVTARVEWTGTAEKGMGRRIGFEAIFTIDRGEFGVNYGIENGALGKDVRVIVALEGVIEK